MRNTRNKHKRKKTNLVQHPAGHSQQLTEPGSQPENQPTSKPISKFQTSRLENQQPASLHPYLTFISPYLCLIGYLMASFV